jgi:TM2 domain-containing membrane protein YozV
MKNEKHGGIILFLITLFLGWLGLDKLYLGSVKLFIIKFLLSFIIIGILWNLYDIVCAAIGTYKLNPLK